MEALRSTKNAAAVTHISEKSDIESSQRQSKFERSKIVLGHNYGIGDGACDIYGNRLDKTNGYNDPRAPQHTVPFDTVDFIKHTLAHGCVRADKCDESDDQFIQYAKTEHDPQDFNDNVWLQDPAIGIRRHARRLIGLDLGIPVETVPPSSRIGRHRDAFAAQAVLARVGTRQPAAPTPIDASPVYAPPEPPPQPRGPMISSHGAVWFQS